MMREQRGSARARFGVAAALVWAVAGAAACTEVMDEGGGEAGEAGGAGGGGEAGAPPLTVTFRGQLYDRADSVGADGLARLPGLPGLSGPAGEARALAARPRVELAEALRMTILHPSGGAYTARAPAWEAADAALHPGGPIDRISRPYRPRPGAAVAAAPHEPAPLDAGGAQGAGVASLVIGSDGRTLSPSTLDPFIAIARVDVYTSATGGSFRLSCTGSYIGPWTFVLAGHCLRFTDGTFARRIVFEAHRAGSSIPHHFDCRNGDADPNNDFLAAVPFGYGGATGEDPLDFAVIDTFPCHAAPHFFPGYIVDSGSTTYSMHGYPLGRCPGASAEGTFMCGMAGPAYLNDWRIETEHIDAEVGQDGAPWWTTSPTRVAGVHVNYREYFDFGRCGFDVCRRNYARRIDGAMDSFIRAVAFDF